jgi:hypothetical protein
MFPFLIKTIVDDSFKNKRDETPVNALQIKHLRRGEFTVSGTRQKEFTIEFVGCDVVWHYDSLTTRNLEYEMMINNQWEEYTNNTTVQLGVLSD